VVHVDRRISTVAGGTPILGLKIEVHLELKLNDLCMWSLDQTLSSLSLVPNLFAKRKFADLVRVPRFNIAHNLTKLFITPADFS